MASDSRQRLALRKTTANTRAKAARRIDRNLLGWYRLQDVSSFAFTGHDLECNEDLRRAFVQAVILAETSSRNVTWN